MLWGLTAVSKGKNKLRPSVEKTVKYRNYWNDSVGCKNYRPVAHDETNQKFLLPTLMIGKLR
jgi:hypothetical protein